MKRSEMLKLIERDLIDAGSDIKFQARMVLARIESCGMLPPNDWHHGVPLTQEAMLKQHEWEPENEKK